MIDQQLVELYARAEQEPQNVDVARRIAGLFEQKNDLDSALWWYNHAAGLTGNTDASLTRKASDLQLRILEHSIHERDAFVKQSPDHEETPRLQTELDDLRRQKAEMLVVDARKRVDRNPTDLGLRFELGEQLLHAAHFTEAIPELQKARQNPNVRIKALNLLGQCYLGKNMLDFAERQFVEAAKELSVMDPIKKDIVYRLGLLYEQMGQKDKALECFKEIYESDYGFADVAQRVESSYSREP
jgi:tetratricopeptide (TPR) repeat protein